MMKNNGEKIRCPKCDWEPDGGKYWACHCGCIWNTFDTYGQCPQCSFVHRQTQCPECAEWSPHADWYVDLPRIKITFEETSKIGN